MTPQIIPSIFTIVDNMTIPIKKIGMSLRNLGTQSTLAAAKMQMAFSATSATAMNMANQSATIAAGILIPLGLATKAAVDFEKGMGNINTLIDSNKESLEQYSEIIKNVSKIIGKPMGDLQEATYQLKSAGVALKDMDSALLESGKLAIAGLGNTVEAANILSSAMNVFKNENLNYAQSADIVFKTIQKGKTKVELLAPEFGKIALAASEVGVSFREMMAMTGAITNTGVQTAEVQTEITGALISLNKRTSDMIDIQEKLSGQVGLTGQEFIKYAGGAVGAMEKVNDYASKNRLDLFKIYGRKEGALASVALTKTQNAAFKDLYTTMQSGNAINEAVEKQQKTAAARMEIFKNSVNRLGIAVGNTLIPALDKLIAVIEPVINGIGEFAHNHKTLAKIIFGSLGTFGLLAASVAGVGFVVGTVTKAFWLWRGAMIAFNWIQVLTIVSTRMLNVYLMKYPIIASAAAGATDTMTAAMTRLNIASKSTLFLFTAIGAAALAVTGAMVYIYGNKNKKESIKLNAENNALKAAIGEEKFNELHSKTTYDPNSGQSLTDFNRKIGDNQKLLDELKIKYAPQIKDSTEALENRMNGNTDLNDAKILFNQAKFAQDSTQKTSFIDTKQSKIIVEINDKTSDKFGVSLGNISGSAAQAVKLKIVTT